MRALRRVHRERSFSASLARAFLRPNRSLWLLLGGVSTLLALALYWPPARSLFHFGTLHWNDLAACALAGGFSLVALALLKKRWFRVGGLGIHPVSGIKSETVGK